MTNIIDTLFVGDDWTIERVISGIPEDTTIVKAWFTVKVDYTYALPVLETEITTDLTTEGGITNTGVNATLIFTIGRLRTIDLHAFQEYTYSIQIKLSTDRITTTELGTLICNPDISTTTS